MKDSLKDFAENCVFKVGAEVDQNRYSGGMKGNRARTETITETPEAITEQVRFNGKILNELAEAVAEIEKQQRRFMDLVLKRLSRVEIIVKYVHAKQIVDMHKSPAAQEVMAQWVAWPQCLQNRTAELFELSNRYWPPADEGDGETHWGQRLIAGELPG